MDIWVVDEMANGNNRVHSFDSGKADPEGVACWLALHVPKQILFFGTLSEEV